MKNTGIVYHSTERTPTVLAELAGLLPPLSGEQLARPGGGPAAEWLLLAGHRQ